MYRNLYTQLTILLFAILTGCSHNEAKYRSIEGAAWHTSYHITYSCGKSLGDSVTSILKQVEMSLSPYAPDTRISAINSNTDMTADSLIERVFLESVRINKLSGGAFEPTLSPLSRLWGFGNGSDSAYLPTQEMIDSALVHIGISRCSLADGKIAKPSGLTEFNFSSITKGMGCDIVAEMLERNGSRDYMVEIGGEIALAGKNPQGNSWRIQIDAPIESTSVADMHNRMVVIQPKVPCGIATSGNYRNYKKTADGRQIGHIIDPKTGYPATTSTLSATVIAPTAMTADALATACMVMDAEDALEMLESLPGVEALIVTAGQQSGKWELRRTPGFPKEL